MARARCDPAPSGIVLTRPCRPAIPFAVRHEGTPRLFSTGDLSAFWALFADNLANLILIMVVCRSVFGMPAEIVYGRILPGLGVALVVGLSIYAALAFRLARREGRSDVTALPYGISTPIMFVYLFGVIGPVHSATGDGLLAWRVGLAAACFGGLIEVAGSLAGPWLKRHLPRAGMLGTLAGIALVFIAAVPLAEIFEHPAIGLPAMAVVLVGLVALVRLPGGVPAGLAAILLGVIIGLLTGETRPSLENVALYLPTPVLGDLLLGFRALLENPWIVAIVVPAEVYNFIETMNNVESAEAAGDRYPVGSCQVVDGLGTIAGALFGSAFPTTVYIGHPGYKRMGGRAGYALGVGVVLFLAAIFGGLAFLHTLVPMAAVAPILVFVGLVITAQAFQASPARHGMAVALAMLPHVSSLLIIKWGRPPRLRRGPGLGACAGSELSRAGGGDARPRCPRGRSRLSGRGIDPGGPAVGLRGRLHHRPLLGPGGRGARRLRCALRRGRDPRLVPGLLPGDPHVDLPGAGRGPAGSGIRAAARRSGDARGTLHGLTRRRHRRPEPLDILLLVEMQYVAMIHGNEVPAECLEGYGTWSTLAQGSVARGPRPCATRAAEPRQARKGATVRRVSGVPQIVGVHVGPARCDSP